MRVRFTPSARAEFLDALLYIRRDNPGAAARLRQRAEHVLRRLERHPDSGRRLPEFPDLPHREVIVRPHRFFYRVRGKTLRGKTVWIVAVWHGARSVKQPSSR